MKRTEALQVMAILNAGMPGAFEQETTALWLEFVEALDNPGRAGAAARDYVKSWKGFRPAWGEYDECYQARATRTETAGAIGRGGGQTTSLPQVMADLRARAERGDRAAAAELAEWEYHLRAPGEPSWTKWGAGGGAARVFIPDLL